MLKTLNFTKLFKDIAPGCKTYYQQSVDAVIDKKAKDKTTDTKGPLLLPGGKFSGKEITSMQFVEGKNAWRVQYIDGTQDFIQFEVATGRISTLTEESKDKFLVHCPNCERIIGTASYASGHTVSPGFIFCPFCAGLDPKNRKMIWLTFKAGYYVSDSDYLILEADVVAGTHHEKIKKFSQGFMDKGFHLKKEDIIANWGEPKCL